MELLERYFDTAFAAPDGIKRLRELILTLAMQGKLVPQDPNDSPASELLKKIEAEKRRLVKEGTIKETRPLPPVTPEEAPYSLPRGWQWVRLGAIAEYNGRDNADPKNIDKKCWVLDLEDIEKSTSRLLYRAEYSERESKSTKSRFKAGDVLYGKLRPYLDKVIIADQDGVCTTELVPIVPSTAICPQFLRWALKSPSFLEYVNGLMYGVKMPRLGTDDAVNSIHPLPPVNEQRRIVAKIDELMARCDALEKLRAERDAQRSAVHTAAVRRLLNVADTEEHSKAREFLGQHFGELYSVKENVTELRKAILQLAVMGTLVPQKSVDEPATQLLRRIKAEKTVLIRDGDLKKQQITDWISREPLAKLPLGWVETTVEELVIFTTDGTHKTPRYVDDGIPFVSAKDIRAGRLTFDECKYITEEEHQQLIRRCKPEFGDILISKSGSIGTVVIVDDKREFSLFESLALVKLSKKYLNARYVYFALRNVCSSLDEQHIRGVAVKHLHLNVLRGLRILLPPLQEQSRIVAKIDQWMSICDTLEQRIDAASETQSALLNSVMAQFGGHQCA
jgi:type I restriction enzyme, S subunit